MRFSVSPRDAIPEEVRRINRLREASEVFQRLFGLTHHQAAFLAALYRGGAMTRPKIAEAAGLSPETVFSAYVRTRHLGVETDGLFYFLNDGLRAACALELRGEALRAEAGR